MIIFNKIFSKEFVYKNEETNRMFNQYFLDSNVSADRRMRADFEKLRIPFWNSAMDKSMMSIPIEVRFPFLDYRLVEFVFKLPIDYLYRDGVTKYLLRKSLNNMLPEEIIWRKKKMGFSVPKQQWINNNTENIKELLTYTRNLNEYVNTKYINDNFQKISPDYIWRIVNFAKWMEIFDS